MDRCADSSGLSLPTRTTMSNSGFPRWLTDADDLPEAARRFREDGYIAVLLLEDCPPAGLPPSLPQEEALAPRIGRRGFLLRRQIARQLAEAITGAAATTFIIESEPDSAPRLSGPSVALHLSYSTRDRYSLIGLSSRPIGVDIELPVTDEHIPWNMLRQEERAYLAALPPSARSSAFARLWSRKEALLKALKLGFSISPEVVRVPLDNPIQDSEFIYEFIENSVTSAIESREFQLNEPKGSWVALTLLSGQAG